MSRITNLSSLTIPGFSLGFAFSVLFGLRRDLVSDAARLSRRLNARYEGLENIPAAGPLAIMPNHYGRKDLHIFWGMFAITNALLGRRDPTLSHRERVPTWLVQDQWPRREGDRVRPDAFTRWLFRRVIKMYDFVPHDPLPERRSARAGALHLLVQRATGRATGQEGKPQPVGIFPEGTTSPDQTLLVPPPGAGTMLGLLSRAGVPILPVALHEPGGVYTVRFGPSFKLETGAGERDKVARDEQWGSEAMRHIAALLPAELRGPYSLDPVTAAETIP